ncbi:MAG TPA: multicopper oxidase family protein [Nocardioidaceae bacterium]|nr:multicopper oxidase family protein [Nocardioidaceae bacterium]
MTPVSRRTVLGLGALGVATAAVGTAGVLTLTRPWRSTRDTVAGGSLREPAVLRSEDGSLEVTLTARSGVHEVAGVRARTLGFNGGLPGPTLVVRPGDRLRIRLVNELDEPTNLHVHGLHVSPRDNGDNVFVEVAPGGSFDYEHRLPEDHPPGLYWYHPHHHGMVADQIYGGLFGAILVEDPEPVAVAADRLLVVSDITLDPDGGVLRPSPMEQMMGREGALVLVNGQARPHVEARSGERQRWRVLNACTSRFLSLRLDGHELHLLGMDGGRHAEPVRTEQVLLAPGNRADLLVTVGRGDGVLRAVPYDRGGMGMGMGGMMRDTQEGPVRLLDLRVTGAAEPPPGLPVFAAPRDLRDEAVDADRDLVLAMGMGMGMGRMSFTIDGREFAADRVDQAVTAGSVEEWTIHNDSPMDHPFHLHVWPMQVLEENGRRPDRPTWLDVVNVPARGSVRMRVAFDGFDGRTVYHCHILDHEDRGMMGVVEAT